MIMLQDSFKESSKQGTEIYTEAFLTKLNKIESELNNTLGHSRRPYKRNHSRNSGHRRNDATGTQVCQANQKILINLDKIVQSIWQTVKTQDIYQYTLTYDLYRTLFINVYHMGCIAVHYNSHLYCNDID